MSQISLSTQAELFLKKKLEIKKNIIVDRKSKYTLVAGYVESQKDVDDFLKYLLKDKYFRKSTHNTYAFRIKLENNSILESKNDDWETGAGMCILRELRRENGVNMCVVVTRYFWGIKLQADRFKNVIDACQLFFEEIKKSDD